MEPVDLSGKVDASARSIKPDVMRGVARVRAACLRAQLAANDLRDPLVADVQHLGDGLHRHAVFVRRADGRISFGA